MVLGRPRHVRAQIVDVRDAVAVRILQLHLGGLGRLADEHRHRPALLRALQRAARCCLRYQEVLVAAEAVALVHFDLGEAQVRLGRRQIARRALLGAPLPGGGDVVFHPPGALAQGAGGHAATNHEEEARGGSPHLLLPRDRLGPRCGRRRRL